MSLSVREAVAQYEFRRLRGKSSGTVAQFYIAVGHLGEFLEREPTVDDFFDERINAFQHSLVERRGIAIETAVSYTKKLLALWRFCNRQRLCETYPEVQLMTVPWREPVAWTQAEMHKLFAALCSQEGYIGPAAASVFWPALLCTFWDSAERLGAVLMLRVDDVNLTGAWAICRAETRKGKLRDRGFPLHQQTVDFIRILLGSGPKRRLVFECPFGEQTLRMRYKGILNAAGLPCDRHRLFHCVRRSVASHFEMLGYSAQEILDHSSREVTKRYLAPQIVRPQHPADVLWRPGQPETTLRE